MEFPRRKALRPHDPLLNDWVKDLGTFLPIFSGAWLRRVRSKILVISFEKEPGVIQTLYFMLVCLVGGLIAG